MEIRQPKVLALILAGGEGGRLDVLTEERAKPAVPYGGLYRLIDFPLSNCRHSGVADVWVLQQYQPHSLTEHLANGRPWDLDRTHGGLRALHPYLGRSESGWYEGNADAIYSNKAEIRGFGADLLLVLSADHVYKLDYGAVVDGHLEARADVTLVTTEVSLEEASRFGVVEVDDGRVTEFAYKPEDPKSGIVTTEVFVYDVGTLMDALDELADDGGGESGLEDFGDALLPRLVSEGRVREHRLESYWRDVGTVESYWQGHMDLVASEPAFVLDDPAWPVLTWATQRPPARIEGSARIDASLVSPGCTVRGEVVRSVLSPGVVVEKGAVVRDSVLLHDTVVKRAATVERAILDAQVCVASGAEIGDGEEIAVVGRDRVDPAG
ncbi:MAG: glucose-1-phosphate adenylyltransferase [Actinomycetota bacterium]|nr:glucose-1-phosphate adenylyltransferase [Actinomycetota bacterium]